ncbi:hypothetical protein Mapa_006385 [Marchantia paleacea]|nr:hypothetical protein Mapa_006385 [Marchantia paleacea]
MWLCKAGNYKCCSQVSSSMFRSEHPFSLLLEAAEKIDGITVVLLCSQHLSSRPPHFRKSCMKCGKSNPFSLMKSQMQ